VAFLGRHGKTEALLARWRNRVGGCPLCSKYRAVSWASLSTNGDWPPRYTRETSLRRPLSRVFFYCRHSMPPATSEALSLREKLCIPRVRGCTLPANGLRNFTRLVPFLHSFAANIPEYARLVSRALEEKNIRNLMFH
jgi:hypothetical protein